MNSQPRGFFEFKDSKGNTIKGRISTWSLNRFCKKMNVPTVSELYTAITTGVSLEAIAEIVLCGVEYTYRGGECPYSVDDALDWIDDIGGIQQAVEFIGETMSVTDDGEKKSGQSVQ